MRPDRQSPEMIWQRALGLLKYQLSDLEFERTLSTSRVLGLEDKHLIVAVPTRAAKDWLDRLLMEVVQQTVLRVAADIQGVQVVVASPHTACCPECGMPLTYMAPLATTPQGPGSWWSCEQPACVSYRQVFKVPDRFFTEEGGQDDWIIRA